jgi:hypothetical protein
MVYSIDIRHSKVLESGEHRGRGSLSGCPPSRASAGDERRPVAGRIFASAAFDSVSIDLHLVQPRHLESGDRSDQSERLQNPNQNDYENDNIEQTLDSARHGNVSID